MEVNPSYIVPLQSLKFKILNVRIQILGSKRCRPRQGGSSGFKLFANSRIFVFGALRVRNLSNLIICLYSFQMRLGPDSSKHRPIFELPWLLQEVGDKKALAECLSNYNVFVLLEK